MSVDLKVDIAGPLGTTKYILGLDPEQIPQFPLGLLTASAWIHSFSSGVEVKPEALEDEFSISLPDDEEPTYTDVIEGSEDIKILPIEVFDPTQSWNDLLGGIVEEDDNVEDFEYSLYLGNATNGAIVFFAEPVIVNGQKLSPFIQGLARGLELIDAGIKPAELIQAVYKKDDDDNWNMILRNLAPVSV
jgi:hypothetical protein